MGRVGRFGGVLIFRWGVGIHCRWGEVLERDELWCETWKREAFFNNQVLFMVKC